LSDAILEINLPYLHKIPYSFRDLLGSAVFTIKLPAVDIKRGRSKTLPIFTPRKAADPCFRPLSGNASLHLTPIWILHKGATGVKVEILPHNLVI
jgi:hypothetical protein